VISGMDTREEHQNAIEPLVARFVHGMDSKTATIPIELG
jgi:hypothetical protein